MSDPVTCDKCGAIGHRKLSAIAPVGWTFARLIVEGVVGDEREYYVYACSPACQTLTWEQGPGRLRDAAPTAGRAVIPDERLHAARVALLRKAIDKMHAATHDCSDMPSLLALVHTQSATINLLAQAAGLVDGEVPP